MVKQQSLLSNSRFYVLVSSLLLSVATFAYLRLQIPSDQLFYIRTQQAFGLFCIIFWYVALVISPIGYIIGKQRIKHLEFARRAIGVSAFYFALLHGSIALWGQLGGMGQLQYLPTLFKWSLSGGLIAFLILAIMAATSFDKVVSYMTFKRWKLLHRLVYVGGVSVILHIWTVGTHLAYTNVQLAAFIALIILSGLELFRITKVSNKFLELDKAQVVTLFFSLWLVVVFMILSIPAIVQNYHSRHADHKGSQHNSKEHHE